MTIEQITTVPSQDQPDSFAADADLCLQQLRATVDSLNEVINYYNAATTTTSTSSVTAATGNLSFTIATGLLGWGVGLPVKINDSANACELDGQIVSYNSGTGALVVNIASFTGTGTYASWNLSLGHPFLAKASKADAESGLDNNDFMTPLRTRQVSVGKNLLINSEFIVNNGNVGVPYVSGATLSSGSYGHEMWKAGASGGDYTFTQLKTATQITILSGKSLIQVVEDIHVQKTSYILSWSGTAQARVGINSNTPSGSYSASPILITGQTIGTVMSVEFNAGTLSQAKLDEGSTVRVSAPLDLDEVLIKTQRYYWSGQGGKFLNFGSSTANVSASVRFPVTMRTTPTVVASAGAFGFSSKDEVTYFQNTAASTWFDMGLTTANARL